MENGFVIEEGVLTSYKKGGVDEVIVPDGVEKIGMSAFAHDTSFTSVKLPYSVKHIEARAFLECKKLRSIEMPGVTSISNDAFNGCESLEEIDAPMTEYVESKAFFHCGKLKRVAFGNRFRTLGLGDNAFEECFELTEVTGLGSLREIGYGAFLNCPKLRSIELPKNLKKILPYAFSGCKALESITIPEGVTEIGESSFMGCAALTSLTLPTGLSWVGGFAFKHCSSLKTISFPKTVELIHAGALGFCSALESIEVEGGSMYYTVVGGCLINKTNKTLVAGCKNSVIPNDGSVAEIKLGAFEGCSGLRSVVIPKSVTVIGERVFNDCSSLESIAVEEGNPEFEAVDGCLIRKKDKTLICGASGAKIPLDGRVAVIGTYAFKGRRGLERVVIPASVVTIDKYAFHGASDLKRVCFRNKQGWRASGSSVDIGLTADNAEFLLYFFDSLLRDRDAKENDENAYCSECGAVFHAALDGYETSCPACKCVIDTDDAMDALAVAFPTKGEDEVIEKSDFEISEEGIITQYYGEGGDVIIPEGVKGFAEKVFYRNKNIVSLTMPSGIDSISSYVFEGCEALERVTLSPDIRYIMHGAFRDCPRLRSVVIPKKTVFIAGSAFENCKALTSVTFENPRGWKGLGPFSYAGNPAHNAKKLKSPKFLGGDWENAKRYG